MVEQQQQPVQQETPVKSGNSILSKLRNISAGVGKFSQRRLAVASRQNRRGVIPASRTLAGVRQFAKVAATGQMPAYGKTKRPVGRPKGVYKNGIPAEQYRTINRQRNRALMDLQQTEVSQLVAQGYTPEEALRVLSTRRQVTQMPNEKFKQVVAQAPLSANTAMMLQRLQAVQNKGKVDDFEMQRRQKERRIIADAGNLLKAPSLFGQDSAKFNIFDEEYNILKAENMFSAEKEVRAGLLNTRRPSILNTREAGHDLKFL